jgi:hypothetical protein
MFKAAFIASVGIGLLATGTVNAASLAAQTELAAVSDFSAQRQVQARRADRSSRSYSVRRAYPARRSFGGIACGPGGCGPVPAGCRPTIGYDFFGNPTGFDDVFCRR